MLRRRVVVLSLALVCAGCDSSKLPPDGAPPMTSALAGPVQTAAPPTLAEVAVAERLAGDLLVRGRQIELLRALTDEGGARLTGTEGHTRAAAWAEARFREGGLDRVWHEAFKLEASWTRGAAAVRIVAPFERPLHAESLGWSPPSPAQGVRGELVFLKDATSRALANVGDSLRGKIVVVDRDSFMQGGKFKGRPSVPIIAAAGASALVFAGRRDNLVLGAFSLSSLRHLVAPLSAVTVGKEDGALLRRLAERSGSVATVTNESRVGGPVDVPIVIAEVHGRERPDEWVLVGAHLDSWDFATGAQDNGTGVVEVIEAARAIAELHTPPRRSIRFALWGGEEEGLLGSDAYARAHVRELDHCVFVLNTDSGGGAPKGWSTDGRADVAAAMAPLLKPLLQNLGDGLEGETTCDTDHCPFALRGVPVLNLDVDTSKYDDIHHTPGDTFEKVVALPVASAAAIVAVTAYAIADAPARVVPRLNAAAITARLGAAKLLEDLRYEGLYDGR